MKGRVVVGVDGSPESVAALRWAAEEARLRKATLHVVTVWEYPTGLFLGMPGAVVPEDMGEVLERGAKNLQSAALAEAIPGEGAVSLETQVVEGHPAWVLGEAAAGAEMLVVGSRGLGGFRELLLGSVSQQCAHHAACPVVIVRHYPPSGSAP
jgi:nucleotide-binding universal stress UspA family protein